MALKTQRGQIAQKNFKQIPVIDWKSLGLTERGAYKQYFTTAFIPLGIYDVDGRTFNLDGTNIADSGITIFKYSWCEPDTEATPKKKGEMPLAWKSVMWADSLMRLKDGDTYDDPGVSLGLTLKQDEQKKAPGLHGASEGAYTMFDPVMSTYRMPVIWNVKVDDEGNVDTNSGDLVWLELSPHQFNMVLDILALYDKQNTATLRKHNITPAENRLFLIKYVKDPKQAMADRNAITVLETMEPNEWSQGFMTDAVDNYANMIESVEKRFVIYQDVINGLNSGQYDAETAASLVHAQISKKLLVEWGEIDEGMNISVDDVNELFLSLVPKYTVALSVTNSDMAVQSTTSVDLSGEDAPF